MATLRVLQVNLCRLLSRLGKSFKSTTVYLPGQSGRSYISRSSEAATQNQRVKALPRGCGSSFSYVQNRPWKVMATLKVPQVNLCRLHERKSHGRESSKKVSCGSVKRHAARKRRASMHDSHMALPPKASQK